MKLSAALFALSTISVALADTCQKVVPMDKLNVTEYIRSSWYIQEQQLTGYQQPKDLFCVVATYVRFLRAVSLLFPSRGTNSQLHHPDRTNARTKSHGAQENNKFSLSTTMQTRTR